MQPDFAVGCDAVGQQRIVGVFTIAASETASGRRVCRIAVQPFDNAAGDGLDLGICTRQPAVKLNDPRTLFQEDLPVELIVQDAERQPKVEQRLSVSGKPLSLVLAAGGLHLV